jgi:hypothetical protein
MTIQIHWADKAERILLCTMLGSWSIAEFDAAYREMIKCARQTDDKIHLIFDMHHCHHPDTSAWRGLIPVSPFLASVFLVFDKQSYESAELIAHYILKAFNVPIDEAVSIEEALSMIASLQRA